MRQFLNTLLPLISLIKYKKLICILFLFFSPSLYAQFPEFATNAVDQIKQTADLAYSEKNYYQALEYYSKIFEKEQNNGEVVIRIAEIYKLLNDYSNAEIWYKISMKLNELTFPLSEYYYALMLKRNNKTDKALFQFEHFIKFYRGDDAIYYQQLAQNEIEGIRLTRQSVKDSLPVEIYNLGETVNSGYDDYAPFKYFDNLVFSSYQSNERLIVGDKDKKIPKTQMFLTSNQGSTWKKPIPFKLGPFTKAGYHTSNGTFSSDGSRFYFTFCKEDKNNVVLCNIYVSRNYGDTWSNPVKLSDDINLPNTNNTQPCVSSLKDNLEVLFFSSNRMGGYGGYDIWYCLLGTGQEYSQVKNAGGMINTYGDEITPFFDYRSQTLYFSSDGHPSIGGFDVYSSLKTGKYWVKSQNLGFPINTTANDIYYILTGKPGHGFLASNREGGLFIHGSNCCHDLYDFQWKDTSKFISKAKTQIVLPITENRKPITELPDSQWVDLGKEIINKTYILKNVYFEYDKTIMLAGSEKDIDMLFIFLTEHQDIKVEISAHTDSKGTDEYNLSLSQQRAQTVVDYLINKGIDRKKMIAKGYGETQPIAANENPDESDNAEGRQMNRRVEFKIIGKVIKDAE